jgi:hypothetical protein
MTKYSKNALRSTERGHLRHFSIKWGIGISLVLLLSISCSKLTKSSNELPEKLKYSKIEFEPCAYSDSPYLCIRESNAIKLVIEFKQCQEQNKLLRELNGN